MRRSRLRPPSSPEPAPASSLEQRSESPDYITVGVALGARSYDVKIGAGLLNAAGTEIAPLLSRSRVAIVTDQTVASLYLNRLTTTLAKSGIECHPLILPSGEATKDWPHVVTLLDQLLDLRFERSDLIVALGGGVIGDLAGFVSSVLLRGVRFVQIPTTLLAQVDSSVGGKTGINTRHGKNLVGAFHQPSLVLADINLLDSLSKRERLAGYSEVLKCALLGDERFFTWLESRGPELISGNLSVLQKAIYRAVTIKAGLVQGDEVEAGPRTLLNLGHTFAHALEMATGFSSLLLHGEAVAVGCQLACDLSVRLGLCGRDTAERLLAHLMAMDMKSRLSDISAGLPDATELFEMMLQDKKARDGRLPFVLVRAIGQADIANDVSPEIVKDLLRQSADG